MAFRRKKDDKIEICRIPDESVKNANTVADTINADSLNSNSAWQASSQQYGNLVCNNNS